MKNNLTTTNQNAKLALIKSKSFLDITNKLLSKKTNNDLTKNLQFKPYFSDNSTAIVKSIAITPDGKHIVSGNDNTIKLWDIQSGDLIRTFYGHISSIQAIVISPNGENIISCAYTRDKTIKLWNIKSGECIRTFEHTTTNWIE